ncbi:MAG TPA: mannose-1-phosphate guanylyltransferase, partial [Alphaproteobacteria bacterium]|nr:mannose-1-phosphate guanylyltransferase [Alphaproteobacteria bacterium]
MSERHRLHPVILCGGSGTRLWPLSRMGFPKQFLVLTSQQSLLQQTLSRVAGDRYAPPIVVGAEEHRFMIADHLQQIRLATQRIILEPAPRSTAAATALAAFHLTKVSKDAMMLVLPADHVIQDPGAFETGVAKAIKLAQSDHLVTFGVEPTGPETGYGYIIRGEESKDVPGGFAVRKFVEKPSQEKAAAMLAAGDCSWNGGMFLFKASVYLRELKRHEPQIYEAAKEAVNKAVNDA